MLATEPKPAPPPTLFTARIQKVKVVDSHKSLCYYTVTINNYTQKDSSYITHVYTGTENAPVQVLDGCVIDLSEVFI